MAKVHKVFKGSLTGKKRCSVIRITCTGLGINLELSSVVLCQDEFFRAFDYNRCNVLLSLWLCKKKKLKKSNDLCFSEDCVFNHTATTTLNMFPKDHVGVVSRQKFSAVQPVRDFL